MRRFWRIAKRGYPLDLHDLPTGWDALPTSDAAQGFGTQWLERAAELVLLVPSVMVPESLNNTVINPLHPRYAEVVSTQVREFHFDPRLYSKHRGVLDVAPGL